MATVNVQEIIDSRKLSIFQVLVVLLCALIVFMDGFDTQAIGYVAPAIVRSWHVDRAELTPVFSAGLFGLMLGALAFGPIADRFGRRPVLVFCTLFFGVLSLLTVTADSVRSLTVLRFLTGLGLGGAMPNAIALTTECAPRRIPARPVMIMFSRFSIGAALGGVVAATLISHFGWKSVFVLGGTVPCVALPFLAALLPESIRYLVVQGGRGEQVAATLRRIDPDVQIPEGATFTVEEHKAKGFAVPQLFAEGRGAFTLLIWVVFFMSLLDLYFLTSWLPTIIHDAGLSVRSAVLITSTYQWGGVIGALLLGQLFDRFSPFVTLALTYLAASAFVLLIGTAGTSIGVLILTVFGAGFCVVGGQIGANALTASSYPTPIRSTGVGWALGIGRIGSIIGPAIGGLLLARHWPARQLFLVAAAPVLIASLASLCIAFLRRTPRPEQALEATS